MKTATELNYEMDEIQAQEERDAVEAHDAIMTHCDDINAGKIESLDDLAAALGEIRDYCRATGGHIDDYVDTTELPTFGGTEPERTVGIYSWDERRILCGDAGWYVAMRPGLADCEVA